MNKAKKSLGQNWLKSESAVKEIIKAGDLKTGELVLEIGPGRGVLTKELLANSCQVIAIEKDDNLITELRGKFKGEIKNKKLILIHDDILKIDFSALLLTYNILIPTYKLIANIPYYITGQVIRKFLSEEKIQPSLMVLMLQKEVAKRIIGQLPNTHGRKLLVTRESLLSISVKAYGTPKYIKTVPAGAFEPRPKVDSAILLIDNISRNFFYNISACPEQDRGAFFDLRRDS